MSGLTVSDLTIRFGAHTIIDHVSFTIPPTGRLGLIGASGSGKSVTSLAITGLLSETATITGSIQLNGQELVGLSEREYRKLRGDAFSMIFQEPMTALDPTMKVGRQIAEVIALHQPRNGKRVAVEEALEMVGITQPQRIADSFPHELSGGQRQRALIAMALINRPSLVLCDEPTTALDVVVQQQILQVLDTTLTGRAALFISHDLAVVRELCQEVAVMERGRIVESGHIDQVIDHPQHPYTAALVQAARRTL